MHDFPKIDREAEADGMRTLFFMDGEFEGKPCRVSSANYLAFLSMRGDEINSEVEKLRRVLGQHTAEELERDIARLLNARNWRFHNIACVALAVGRSSERSIAALWECLSSGSWTSPQLAATAAYIDPLFQAKALGAVENHVTYYKSIVSLAEILKSDLGVSLPEASGANKNLLEARSIDRDNSGAIAIGWLANLRNAFGPTFNSSGSPAAPAEF
jgi:hypothetical protein